MASSLRVVTRNQLRAGALILKLCELGLTVRDVSGNSLRFTIWNGGLQGQYSRYGAEYKYPKNQIKINRILKCQTKEELFDLITELEEDR